MLSIRARKAQKVLSNLVPLGSAQAHSRVLNHIISASIILTMRYVLAVLGLVGAVVSGLALQVHYTIATTPCSINEKWDCGVVNHSSYSMISGIPVAAIGIAGYLVLVRAVSSARGSHSRCCRGPCFFSLSGSHRARYPRCLVPLLRHFTRRYRDYDGHGIHLAYCRRRPEAAPAALVNLN